MQEQYAWVDWFNELAQKIAGVGADGLAEFASRIQWRDDGKQAPILRYGPNNVDPFSFVYTLAANCGSRPSRTRIVQSASDVFELQASLPVDLDEAFYFPQGLPLASLFHSADDGNPELLWEMFRDALRGIDAISADTFHQVLQIKNVGAAKLTQALFLVDGKTFVPYDKSTRFLLPGDAPKTPDWSRYRRAIQELQRAFPGARLCEINLYGYLRSRGELPGRVAYQVSSNVYNDGLDHWHDFDINSCVYTGGQAPDTEFGALIEDGVRAYPLQEPEAGDLVLARNAGNGKAVGVVWINEYKQSMTAQSRMHVLWLNKTDAALDAGFSLGRGFSRAYKIENAFRRCEPYGPTFAVLDRLRLVSGLTTAAVLGALREVQQLGREGFIARYGPVDRPETRWINYDDERYEMIPVWRAAFGHVQDSKALTPDDERYEAHSDVVQSVFEELGFTVVTDGDAEPVDKSIGQPLNQILYGPPGTGKTWNTVSLALAIVEGDPNALGDRGRFDELAFDPAEKNVGNIAMVTFHQNYAYEDFVEGIRPVLTEDSVGLQYELRGGVFKNIAAAARSRSTERFVLVIDEINRGNVARIFGELITLIEEGRRLGQADETQVTLPYSNERFGVPSNLYLIGTMNTADRSIQLLDTALRRRFAFVEMMPEPNHPDMASIEGLDCPLLLQTINDRIAVLLDREHQIGHTYLLGVTNVEALGERFKAQIFPLLQEYFFDDWSKIKAVLGRSPFVVERRVDAKLEDLDLTDDDLTVYERLSNDNDAWASEEAYRAIYESDVAPAGG